MITLMTQTTGHWSDENILDQDDQGQGIIDILSQSIISNLMMTVDEPIAAICNFDFQFCNCPLCFFFTLCISAALSTSLSLL